MSALMTIFPSPFNDLQWPSCLTVHRATVVSPVPANDGMRQLIPSRAQPLSPVSTGARMAQVERVFKRYGPVTVTFARFFNILRQLNGIVAGMLGMS